MGVQGILQFFETVTPVEVEGRHLPTGVGASIRASSQINRLSMPAKFPQGFFKFALRRPGTRLSLASKEVSAVVSEDNLVTCHYTRER